MLGVAGCECGEHIDFYGVQVLMSDCLHFCYKFKSVFLSLYVKGINVCKLL